MLIAETATNLELLNFNSFVGSINTTDVFSKLIATPSINRAMDQFVTFY